MRIEPDVIKVYSYSEGELVIYGIESIFCVIDNPYYTSGDIHTEYFTTYESARECFEELKNEIR